MDNHTIHLYWTLLSLTIILPCLGCLKDLQDITKDLPRLHYVTGKNSSNFSTYKTLFQNALKPIKISKSLDKTSEEVAEENVIFCPDSSIGSGTLDMILSSDIKNKVALNHDWIFVLPNNQSLSKVCQSDIGIEQRIYFYVESDDFFTECYKINGEIRVNQIPTNSDDFLLRRSNFGGKIFNILSSTQAPYVLYNKPIETIGDITLSKSGDEIYHIKDRHESFSGMFMDVLTILEQNMNFRYPDKILL